jgi:hypothetical protein
MPCRWLSVQVAGKKYNYCESGEREGTGFETAHARYSTVRRKGWLGCLFTLTDSSREGIWVLNHGARFCCTKTSNSPPLRKGGLRG